MAFGDFTVTRASTKNVLGSAGTYVSVANNVPAFEFNADGSYRGLLVEPGATNLALQSQAFNEAVWTKTASTVTANASVSPDGATTADKLLDTIANTAHFVSQSFTASAVAYSFSCYLKASEITEAQVYIREASDSGTVYGGGTFNLSLGTVLTTLAGTATIEAYPNGWYRVNVSGTAVAGTRFVAIRLQKAGNTNFIGTGTDGIFIWQAQLETGSVATSPIVTTGSTASRVADVVTLTGASSLIGQTEGTLYAKAIMRSVGAVGRSLLDINDGTTNNRISLLATGTASDLFRFSVIVSGVAQCQFDSSFTSNTLYKTAIAYKANDFTAYINGVSLGTDTSGTVPALSQITIGNLAGGILQLNGWIRSVALYTTRLSNAQLASLTA